jgi:hypothetical protein
MSTVGELFETLDTLIAGETIAKGEGVSIDTTDPTIGMLKDTGGILFGVAQYGAAEGEAFAVVKSGRVLAKALDDTAITVGEGVACDNAGRWIPADTSSNYPCHGIARSAAPGTGDGEMFLVEIPANYPAVLS